MMSNDQIVTTVIFVASIGLFNAAFASGSTKGQNVESIPRVQIDGIGTYDEDLSAYGKPAIRRISRVDVNANARIKKNASSKQLVSIVSKMLEHSTINLLDDLDDYNDDLRIWQNQWTPSERRASSSAELYEAKVRRSVSVQNTVSSNGQRVETLAANSVFSTIVSLDTYNEDLSEYHASAHIPTRQLRARTVGKTHAERGSRSRLVLRALLAKIPRSDLSRLDGLNTYHEDFNWPEQALVSTTSSLHSAN